MRWICIICDGGSIVYVLIVDMMVPKLISLIIDPKVFFSY